MIDGTSGRQEVGNQDRRRGVVAQYDGTLLEGYLDWAHFVKETKDRLGPILCGCERRLGCTAGGSLQI
jgi:hypothetical protein